MKKDLWIIGGVLLAALVALLLMRPWTRAGRETGVTVIIHLHDTVYARVPADRYQTITIDQGDGKVNIVEIGPAGVCMHASTCKNQICVKQGTLDPAQLDALPLNNWIVCLPNGVSVELAAEEEGGA